MKATSWCAIALLLVGSSSPSRAETLVNGWEQTLDVQGPCAADGGRMDMRVDKGWLRVQRVNRSGQVDWAVVLAPVQKDVVPVYRFNPIGYLFTLQYGKFEIHEDPWFLDVLRARKTGAWPQLSPPLKGEGNWGTAQGETVSVRDYQAEDHWTVCALGPRLETSDAFVCLALNGSVRTRQGPHEVEVNDAQRRPYWLKDDGEHLTCRRLLHSDIEPETPSR